MSTYRDIRLQHIHRGQDDRANELLGGYIVRASNGSFRFQRDFFGVRSDVGVIAIERATKKVVGIVLGNLGTARSSAFFSSGSWVAPSFRRRGLAVRMWRALVKRHAIQKVVLKAISDSGYTLGCALQKSLKRVEFEIVEMGDRELRDLRKRKGGSWQSVTAASATATAAMTAASMVAKSAHSKTVTTPSSTAHGTYQ